MALYKLLASKLLFLCCSSLAFAGTTDFPSQRETDHQAEVLIAQVRDLGSVDEKITALTDYFIKGNYPYAYGPLGEGPTGHYNQSPLYRFDVFDCTTFVETVVSLAQARDLPAFQANMNNIRYKDSEISFVTRNHFPSSDWVPNNIANGIFVDATQDVREKALDTASAYMARVANTPLVYINKKAWYGKLPMDRIVLPKANEAEKEVALAALHAESANVKNDWAYLPYLSLKTIFGADDPEAILTHIPNGAVIQIVRPGWDLREAIGTRMLVSHQGFVIQRDGRAYFRHAASVSSVFRVVEQPLFDYLQPYWAREGVYDCTSWGKGKNCVQGINILAVMQ